MRCLSALCRFEEGFDGLTHGRRFFRNHPPKLIRFHPPKPHHARNTQPHNHLGIQPDTGGFKRKPRRGKKIEHGAHFPS